MFNSDIMECNHHNCESVIVRVGYGSSSARVQLFLSRVFFTSSGNQLILNQEKRLHSMMKGQLMFSHL